ncbi:MAG: cyclic nucleotide-binding domain-containing protein, partial [Gammaproteobacteria bacterium]|nr:cyclic nucleotide-binding domain-containing protein [Gammaproteobacteria bacterium]
FGGVLVGAVVGFGISEIMRRIKSSSLALVVMTLVMAYASFVLAEHTLHVSGVMAALSAAIAMGLYAVTRIPQTATRLIHETWEVIALIANSLLFLMIGLTVDLGNLIASGGAILLAAVLVVLARAAAIYSLVPVATRAFRLPTVSMGERHIMWWGGLKGGLAIAIVLSIPEELAGRDFLVTLTLGVVMFTLLVNAPTIRPLIARLGIDRLTMDEQIESNRAFVDAGRHSAEALQRFRAAGLLETGRVEALQQAVQLAIADGDSEPPPPQLRSTYLEAFRIERSELDVLFEIAMIHEYTYLDMLASLRRRRDSWGELHGDTGPESSAAPNPFERIERAMLHWTREQNLLAGLLARYQRLRFGQRLQRDIAGIMTSVRVIGLLPSRPGLDPEHVDTVLAGYRRGLARKRERVAQIARDFPAFYQRFEERFFETAALNSALHRAESTHEDGNLGAKAYQRLKRALTGALADMPELVNPTQELDVLALIDRVPLFSGLSQTTQQRLADLARTVSFLPDDVVIGQDQRGNALYIITQGSVGVYKHRQNGDRERVAGLAAGDFFGETALLGDDVRTATVLAESPLVLLRLTRRAVDELAADDHTIAARLNAARDARR